MTTISLGKLPLDNHEPALQNILRTAAVLVLIILVAAATFTAVNAALPVFAEMRIQAAVNALSQDGLTAQRQRAMSEIENAGENAVPALLVALRSENPVLRRNTADMLGYIASPQAVPALRNTLVNDPEPQVRINAAWALGEINDLSTLNNLQQAALLDSNQSVRRTAADSIARIRTRLALVAGVNEQGLSAFAAAPSDSNQVYLATRRDIVSTRDGGKTWMTYANALPSLVTTLAVSPTDTNLLYASAPGLGLLKSTDGGGTWSAINTGLAITPGSRFSVTAIAIDATNPQRLFITTGVWVGTSEVHFFPIALMRSVDSGATWQVYQTTTNVDPVTQLAIKGERLYALAGDRVLIY
jgi:HEAT repeats